MRVGLVLATLLLLVAPAARAGGDVPFLESPQPVVEAMLKLADVQAGDTVYDLGSGDGRIVITAAARYGCEAVGLELDVLVEVHEESELDVALQIGADLIGVNNRDLRSFDVDLSVTERLAKRVPRDWSPKPSRSESKKTVRPWQPKTH